LSLVVVDVTQLFTLVVQQELVVLELQFQEQHQVAEVPQSPLLKQNMELLIQLQ